MNIISGNIFCTELQTIVNTVNCFGVMGTGLALECRYRYPEMFVRYKELCDKKLLDIGKLYIYKTDSKWLLNFPTKYHWKFDTKPEYLEIGLQRFRATYKQKGISSAAFPLLGAQNGGLSKTQSLEILEKHLQKIDIPIEIYEYDSQAPDDIFQIFKKVFLNFNESMLKQASGLNGDKIKKIRSILETEQIANMSHFATSKGLGDKSIEKCFQFAMKSKNADIQLNLL